MNQFKPETQELINRIAKVDFSKFIYDKDKIKSCLYLHLKNLNLPKMHIVFSENFFDGYSAAWSAARNAAENAAWNAARNAAENAARNAAWSVAENAAWSAARSAAQSAAWSAAQSAARSAAWSVAWSVAQSAAWSAARNAAQSAARNAAWSVAENAAWSAARNAAESAARSAAWSVAESAAWSAAWSVAESAALQEYIKTDEDFKYFHIWLPFLEAFESGLWIFWITEKNIICIPRPVITLKGQLLHNETAPAMYFPQGEKYYFLNGVQVREEIVKTSAENLDPKLVMTETNAEIRREIVRKIGIEKVCQKLNAKLLDKKGNYELLNLDLGDSRVRPYLKMVNPSTGTFHIEGVEPRIKTVEDSLNWRNGTKEEPIILT